MRTIAAIGLTLLGASTALAALPPQYQRQAELVAIIESPDVVEVFGIERPIEGVRITDVDVYEVTGGGCRMQVRIIDVPRTENGGIVGPRSFAVEAGELFCED